MYIRLMEEKSYLLFGHYRQWRLVVSRLSRIALFLIGPKNTYRRGCEKNRAIAVHCPIVKWVAFYSALVNYWRIVKKIAIRCTTRRVPPSNANKSRHLRSHEMSCRAVNVALQRLMTICVIIIARAFVKWWLFFQFYPRASRRIAFSDCNRFIIRYIDNISYLILYLLIERGTKYVLSLR